MVLHFRGKRVQICVNLRAIHIAILSLLAVALLLFYLGPHTESSGSRNQFGAVRKMASFSVEIEEGKDEKTRTMEDIMKNRRERVRQVCQEENLTERSASNQPNAWEFFIIEEQKIIFCPIFKAASSSWLMKFISLSENAVSYKKALTKKSPIEISRKIYPRPTVAELDRAMNPELEFLKLLVVRHPLERVVSAYRNKFETLQRFYKKIANTMMATYTQFQPKYINISTLNRKDLKHRRRNINKKVAVPSFQQFVQFLIDSRDKGDTLDEHWTPIVEFCSPCTADFDIYVKVETQKEDGKYFLSKSKIGDQTDLEWINPSSGGNSSKAIALKYCCQLTRDQLEKLINIFRLDFKLFGYDYSDYLECHKSKKEVNRLS